MRVVFMSYPDRAPRRGWYVVGDDGVAVGPFGARMGIDLFTEFEAIGLGIGVGPLTRRTLPAAVLEELRGAARAGSSAVVVCEERLDELDAGADPDPPSRDEATWRSLSS